MKLVHFPSGRVIMDFTKEERQLVLSILASIETEDEESLHAIAEFVKSLAEDKVQFLQ